MRWFILQNLSNMDKCFGQICHSNNNPSDLQHQNTFWGKLYNLYLLSIFSNCNSSLKLFVEAVSRFISKSKSCNIWVIIKIVWDLYQYLICSRFRSISKSFEIWVNIQIVQELGQNLNHSSIGPISKSFEIWINI